jgi:hypothetical protein
MLKVVRSSDKFIAAYNHLLKFGAEAGEVPQASEKLASSLTNLTANKLRTIDLMLKLHAEIITAKEYIAANLSEFNFYAESLKQPHSTYDILIYLVCLKNIRAQIAAAADDLPEVREEFTPEVQAQFILKSNPSELFNRTLMRELQWTYSRFKDGAVEGDLTLGEFDMIDRMIKIPILGGMIQTIIRQSKNRTVNTLYDCWQDPKAASNWTIFSLHPLDELEQGLTCHDLPARKMAAAKKLGELSAPSTGKLTQ